MTDEKIISFARTIRDGGHWDQLDLINFARMIETHLSYASIHSCGPDCDRPACVNVRRAVEREREECALLCERIKLKGREVFADAIRSRNESQ
jgi:hypothetical protein